MTLDQLQAEVESWIGQFATGYFPPLLMVARLAEETGEVARVVAHSHGKTKKPSDPDDLALEIGDLLFVLTSLANSQGISLEAAFGKAMAKYAERDSERWPRRE